jgi:membrane associated rhomboid family serine protease
MPRQPLRSVASGAVTDPVASPDEDYDWHCYRHPDREAGVKCRRCERPICPDCMVSAPVGFQCRQCVKAAPPVRSVRSMRSLTGDPYVAIALIAVNVVIFFAGQGAGDQTRDLGLNGVLVANGDWWRIVTSGFLHLSLLHLAFNMFLLWWLGRMLEPTLGMVRFGVLYATALLGGSLGVLLLDPDAITGGASGAVFGLMGAAVVLMRSRGIDVMQSGLGGLLLINLLLSFRPGVSIGGHFGGLVGGAIAGWVLAGLDRDQRERWLGAAACVLVSGVFVAASLWVAANPI